MKDNEKKAEALPAVHQNHITGESGVNYVSHNINAMNYIFRRMDNRDYGIDAEIEVTQEKDDKKYATGKKILAQIKCGDSFFEKPTNDTGWNNYFDNTTVNYWLNHDIPVIVIICDLDGNCYWQLVQTYNLEKKDKTYKLFFPAKNKLANAKVDFYNIAHSLHLQKEVVVNFLLDDQINLANDKEELQVMCGEAMLAIARKLPLRIDVSFAREFQYIETLSKLKSIDGSLTLENRRDILEAEKQIELYMHKRRFLTNVIKLVMHSTFFKSQINSFYNNGHYQLAQNIEGIFKLYAHATANPGFVSELMLEAYHSDHKHLATKIDLDGDDAQFVQQKLNKDGGLQSLRFPGHHIVNLLGADIINRIAIPAVALSIQRYLERTHTDPSDLKLLSSEQDALFFWYLGLA